MAKLNVNRAIEQAAKEIPSGYTMTCGTMREILNKNANDTCGVLFDGFYLGFAQGMKVAKAKMRAGAIR